MSKDSGKLIIPEFIVYGYGLEDSKKSKKSERTRLLSHKYIKKLLRMGYIFETNAE